MILLHNSFYLDEYEYGFLLLDKIWKNYKGDINFNKGMANDTGTLDPLLQPLTRNHTDQNPNPNNLIKPIPREPNQTEPNPKSN